MSVEERLARLEQAFATLTELAVRADERMDSHDRSFDELDTKIAALTDAQIKTEAALAKLAETQERTESKLSETDGRLNRLADIVERYISEGRDGK